MNERKRICVLGNCVAYRLQMMLAAHAELTERYALVYMPTVYEIARLPDRDTELERLARRALSCDIILSQPLFSFGPCNTRQLRDRLSPGQKLLTFSAPDFGGYFPDVCWLSGKTRLRFAPVQDWDSRIIFACYVRGVSIFEVERIYLSHPMFGPRAMLENVAWIFPPGIMWRGTIRRADCSTAACTRRTKCWLCCATARWKLSICRRSPRKHRLKWKVSASTAGPLSPGRIGCSVFRGRNISCWPMSATVLRT